MTTRHRLGFALCIVVLAQGVVCGSSIAKTVPTFVWGSCGHLDALYSSKVSYQTVPAVRLVGEVLESLSSIRGATDKPDVVLIALGNQLPVDQLPNLARGPLKPLRQFLDKAASSLSLPFAQYTEKDDLYGKLSTELQKRSDGKATNFVDACQTEASQLQSTITKALKNTAAQLSVVLVCNHVKGDIEQDMNILMQAQEAVESASKNYLTMYTANAADQVQRRALTETMGDDAPYTCNDKCKAQVRVLEAAILILILLVAIGAGTWLMGAVDTPTRYETSKEKPSGGVE